MIDDERDWVLDELELLEARRAKLIAAIDKNTGRLNMHTAREQKQILDRQIAELRERVPA